MEERFTEFVVADGVARLRFTRASKRNALSRETIAQLAAAVDEARRDDSVRTLVLEADGPVFCAGMDLGEMQDRARQPDALELWHQDTVVYRDLLVDLLTLPLPTLAVVQGPVLAGGVGLVAACDMVIGTTSATCALPEPRRGITAAVVAPLLIHRIGPGAASFALLSGATLDAETCYRQGLYHQLCEPGDLTARVDQRIEEILSGAPAALAMTKQHLLDCLLPNLLPQLEAGMEVSARARETGDAREGLAAFFEKRPPAWQ